MTPLAKYIWLIKLLQKAYVTFEEYKIMNDVDPFKLFTKEGYNDDMSPTI